MRPISRSRPIVVTVPLGTARGATLRFPNDQYLRDKRITGIEYFDEDTQSTSDDGIPLATKVDGAKASLTLVRDSKLIHAAMPVLLLDPIRMRGIWKEFVPFSLDLTSSFVFLSGTPAAGFRFGYAFMIHYEDQ